MKCNRCEFEYCESNEYGTEYGCAVFGDDVPEEFETYEGCNLRYNEAKKLCELNDKCIEKYYGSMYVLYALSDGNPTKEQQAEIDRIEKGYSLASKKIKNYYDVLVNGRKINGWKRIIRKKQIHKRRICKKLKEQKQ